MRRLERLPRCCAATFALSIEELHADQQDHACELTQRLESQGQQVSIWTYERLLHLLLAVSSTSHLILEDSSGLGTLILFDDKNIAAGPCSGHRLLTDHRCAELMLAVFRQLHEARSPRIG